MSTDGSTALGRQIASQAQQLEAVLERPLPESAIERLTGASRIWFVGTGTSQHAAELGASMFEEGRPAGARDELDDVHEPHTSARGRRRVRAHQPQRRRRDGLRGRGLDGGDQSRALGRRDHAGRRIPPVRGRDRREGAVTHVHGELHRGARAACSACVRGGGQRVRTGGARPIPDALRSAIADPVSIEQPERLLVLAGEGPAAVTAREGALKVREASRFPAEGYDVEYLLHGHAVPLNASDHLVTLAPPDSQGLTAGVEAAARAVGIGVTRVEESADLPRLLAQIPLTVRLQSPRCGSPRSASRIPTRRSRAPGTRRRAGDRLALIRTHRNEPGVRSRDGVRHPRLVRAPTASSRQGGGGGPRRSRDRGRRRDGGGGVLRRGERGRALGRRPPLLRGRDRRRPHRPRDPGARRVLRDRDRLVQRRARRGSQRSRSSCTTTSCTWTSTCSPRRRRANTMPASPSSSCGIATGSPPGSPRMIGPTSRVTCDGSRTGCGPGAGTSSRRSSGASCTRHSTACNTCATGCCSGCWRSNVARGLPARTRRGRPGRSQGGVLQHDHLRR